MLQLLIPDEQSKLGRRMRSGGEPDGVLTTSYGSLLRTEGVRPLLASALVAGLPAAMLPLALVVLVRQATGSYPAAGIVLAAEVAVRHWGRLSGAAALIGSVTPGRSGRLS
jgi:hypothetical protein